MLIYILIALNIASIFVCHYVAKSREAKPVFLGRHGRTLRAIGNSICIHCQTRIEQTKLVKVPCRQWNCRWRKCGNEANSARNCRSSLSLME